MELKTNFGVSGTVASVIETLIGGAVNANKLPGFLGSLFDGLIEAHRRAGTMQDNHIADIINNASTVAGLAMAVFPANHPSHLIEQVQNDLSSVSNNIINDSPVPPAVNSQINQSIPNQLLNTPQNMEFVTNPPQSVKDQIQVQRTTPQGPLFDATGKMIIDGNGNYVE